MRIGVALVQQETNTFSLRTTTWADFTVLEGEDAAEHVAGSNSEMAGAMEWLLSREYEPVPLLFAWALPAGPVDRVAFHRLRELLTDRVRSAGSIDGLVLALHGSMVADENPDADAVLIETARHIAGDIPIGVTLDLHANVTRRMVAAADAMSGYHTDPHVDMGETGARVASHVAGILDGTLSPRLAIAKKPMIFPAEKMNTTTGPLGAVRRRADERADVVDVSLFPVQPWLDVPELGFGVLVTAHDDPVAAQAVAGEIADEVWDRREAFRVDGLRTPDEALAEAAASRVRPFLVAESADAPTAGAAGDSPAMVSALLRRDDTLSGVVPVVDPPAVAIAREAGVGADIAVAVGASLDDRWWAPVDFHGTVLNVGEGTYRLKGAGFTGLSVTMGAFAVVAGGGITLLLSEQPAWTSDPATFEFAGIDVADFDVLVVRSCSDFRPNFPQSADAAVALDVPGTATPRLELLEFNRADRPLWPLDAFPDDR